MNFLQAKDIYLMSLFQKVVFLIEKKNKKEYDIL